MNETLFKICLAGVALAFCTIFAVVVIPALFENPDILAAFAAGFVNPFAAGYSADVFACYAVLLLWVLHERREVRYGWLCLVLGVVPGVAVGLALYLILRSVQLHPARTL